MPLDPKLGQSLHSVLDCHTFCVDSLIKISSGLKLLELALGSAVSSIDENGEYAEVNLEGYLFLTAACRADLEMIISEIKASLNNLQSLLSSLKTD